MPGLCVQFARFAIAARHRWSNGGVWKQVFPPGPVLGNQWFEREGQTRLDSSPSRVLWAYNTGMSRTKPPPKALNDEELTTLILASGYPLELRLFHALTDAGMSPIHGHRIALGAETKEIDLITSLCVRERQGNDLGEIGLSLLIAAKKLHAPMCFVGFPGERPDDADEGLQRATFAGSPSWDVNRDVPTFVSSPTGYAEALQPLCSPPLCVQWGAVCKQKDRLELMQYHPIYDDMLTLARAALTMDADVTNAAVSQMESHPFPLNRLHLPTLILDTPTLYAYDVKGAKLLRTDSLVVRFKFEDSGRMATRNIDVITADSLPEFLTTHEDILARLRDVFVREFPEIALLAHAEAKAWKVARDPAKMYSSFMQAALPKRTI